MSHEPIHAPAPSSYRGVVRYSLCVLVAAIALALALDASCQLGRLLVNVYSHWYPVNFRVFYHAAPVFLLVAVALIAWRFRKGTK